MHESPHPQRTVTACTIVARNYLPAARTLAGSYLKQHPRHHFVVAVIDSHETDEFTRLPTAEAGGDYQVVGMESFGIDEQDYLRMATAYSVTELATSVKPYLLRELRRRGSDVAVYLDPDIQVFAAMPEIESLAIEHSVVLTPHFLTPLPRDGNKPTEADIMGAGIFNLGFVATGPGSEPFLDFWSERLRHDAIVAPEMQLFTDQRWVDQVPALFQHHVLRDPGFNVAYWNLHERELSRNSDGKLSVNGMPLRFFHFSGYRPETSWLLSHHSAHKPRTLLSEHPLLREICDSYGQLLRSAGYADSLAAIPYGFDRFGDSEPLPTSARRIFRTAWIDSEHGGHEPPPHAYEADGGKSLRLWLTEPADQAEAASGLHRLALSVWRARADLQVAFPQPTAADAGRFRDWCDTSGRSDGDIPGWATLGRPTECDPPANSFGVNIAGYLTAQLGVGEMGRLVYEAVTNAGIDTVSVVEEHALLNHTGVEHVGLKGTPRFPLSILAINADQTSTILNHYPELGHGRYKIGLWAWELEEFPDWLHSAFAQVDEVWTVSEFCRRSIATHSPVPVKTFPATVRDYEAPQECNRHAEGRTRFLFAFDFNSVAERKNPYGLVHAFRKTFGERHDARLTIKAINGDRNPDEAERLRLLIGDDERIELIERYMSAAELDSVYRSSDCYVSLHRSEGFGLTLAEAMIRQLPVISTDYSSTTEFVDELVGWPIAYTMTTVGNGHGPYPAGAVWADPDLYAAAAAMREVADDPEEAARRGRAARERIRHARSMAATSSWVATELRAAYEAWQRRQSGDQTEQHNPLQRLAASKEALRWRPDTDAPSRSPLAPALRKAVVRTLDHYDVHQRTVLTELIAGVEGTSSELLDRIERLEERAGSAEKRFHEIASEATQQAVASLRQQHGSASEELAALRQRLDELSTRVTSGEQALNQVNDLSDAVTSNARGVDAVAFRAHELEAHTHRGFRDRDERASQGEAVVDQVRRDLDVAQQALRLRHAPLPHGSDVVLCDVGALLLPVDDVVWRWISHYHTWEPDESRLMARLMDARPGAFLDVGAHVGYHTLRIAQSCPSFTRIVAVEAEPGNIAYLQRNVTANLATDAATRVHSLCVAAWDRESTLELVRRNPSNSGDNRVCELTQDADTSSATRVPARRLDQVAEVTAEPVTVVKLDLQGQDHRAIDGLAGVLARDRPDVVCEFFPDAIMESGGDPAHVLASYRALGYVVHALGSGTGSPTDQGLIEKARDCERGDITLWLRPG